MKAIPWKCEVCRKELTDEEQDVNRKQTADAGEPLAWLCAEHRPSFKVWISVERKSFDCDGNEQYEDIEETGLFGGMEHYDTLDEALAVARVMDEQHRP